MHSHATQRANLHGIGWMVAAMAAFAVEDTLLKTAARQLPIGQILVLFGLAGAAFFAWRARRSGATLYAAAHFSRLMLLRAVFELTGRLFYVLAIALTPLSNATALLQATPIVVVLGGIVFFGETVDWKRWCAIIAGLIGVLIVLHPSADDFSALSLLTVIAVLGFAGRDLASRAAPPTLGVWLLGHYGFLTVTLAGVLYGLWDGKPFTLPTAETGMALAAAAGIGVFAYTALMHAMRTGSIAIVTPFRYSRLLFGVSLGIAVFGEQPDGRMLAGCLVILAAGLAIWRLGRPSTAPR